MDSLLSDFMRSLSTVATTAFIFLASSTRSLSASLISSLLTIWNSSFLMYSRIAFAILFFEPFECSESFLSSLMTDSGMANSTLPSSSVISSTRGAFSQKSKTVRLYPEEPLYFLMIPYPINLQRPSTLLLIAAFCPLKQHTGILRSIDAKSEYASLVIPTVVAVPTVSIRGSCAFRGSTFFSSTVPTAFSRR